jgi:citrate/tricarballylate utilization protein
MRSSESTAEARRSMEICNACRYCEGFCAVFPAMELRRSFSDGDLSYLANLCHDCRGCFYACQYAPPHEFALNLPKALAEVRAETYEAYAWPAAMAVLFRRNGTVLSVATAAGIALSLLLVTWVRSPEILLQRHRGPGAFYQVISEGAMISIAGAATLFCIIALAMGAIHFWRDTGGGSTTSLRALGSAARDVLTLPNLGGGGHGCNDRGEAFSLTRRRFHHAMFYGLALCLASTSVAAVYDHLLRWPAPYPFLSLPVLLGTAGGIGMVVGSGGLLWLKMAGDPEPTARKLRGGEYALVVQLFLASVTGLLLLGLRDTRAMGILLAVHLGVIFSFLIMIPYSKLVHGIYRSAALLRSAHERQAIGAPTGGGH